MLWKFRHRTKHDVHSHHGPSLSSRHDAAVASQQPPFTEIDLTDTLRGLGIAEKTIELLHHQVGAKGILIMVVRSAIAWINLECILLNNRGARPRTVMVTEQAKITS